MASLHGRTLFITGASRGIGLAIALRAARDGANIVIAAKTKDAHPRLPGTIFSAAEAIEKAGGKALPIVTDIRLEEQVAGAIALAVKRFGGIDILINNASAIQLTPTAATELKRFDLMHQVNVRGTFLCSKLCLPYLERSSHPHVLTMAPPVNLKPEWFENHVAYTLSKFGMAMATFGMAAEFRDRGIGFNCLWPRTIIQTAALAMIPGIDPKRCRTPEIVADAAHVILSKNPREFTGHFCIDEEILKAEGVNDFSRYSVDPSVEPLQDLFV
jgi:Dehydrogenases with different specificities (related to short-chain alcohol dehydrogenases)